MLEFEYINKEISSNSIIPTIHNFMMHQNLSHKENLEISWEKQSNEMSSSTDLVRVELPLSTTNDDIITPVNTGMPNFNISTQVHHEQFKPKFMKNQCTGISDRPHNYKKWSTQESTYQCQHCSYISKHLRTNTNHSQQQRILSPRSYRWEVPERIHVV